MATLHPPYISMVEASMDAQPRSINNTGEYEPLLQLFRLSEQVKQKVEFAEEELKTIETWRPP